MRGDGHEQDSYDEQYRWDHRVLQVGGLGAWGNRLRLIASELQTIKTDPKIRLRTFLDVD
jgi:hypothetical protein